ncbi:YhgE/Pip family protein [Microbacterium galbinum]|uniref:YhgE/Pip family protein n=1 Tax=Microbacterium galbinum TaxID=2851646 RepID=UPI001FFC833F|nr:YhgE/Pip family protein [Microbacterium galbinum]MCK2029360.1 YhgE/Pip family protein [Microbacterium galbinum]
MTLPIERARSRKPITWLTILGILLLPAAIGGILVTALQNPTERLDSMAAAIVNLDEPVEIDGQVTPLGRQLASGLVEGSDDLDSNLTWVISNEDDAAEGLANGDYQAVITIPEDFSSAATSAGRTISEGEGTPEKATIEVTTPDDGLVADDLITGQIANVAASTLGTTLSEATTENILVGFTTIGDQIGEAASGARDLANGARDAATGAAAIPDGATQLATGAGDLGTGATSLATGLDTIATNTRQLAGAAGELGAGLTGGAAALNDPNGDFAKLVGAAQGGAPFLDTAASESAKTATELGKLAATCAQSVTDPDFCTKLGEVATSAATSATAAGTASAYLSPVATGLPAAASTLATNMNEAGTGASQISAGLNQLATEGVDQSAAGARALATGAGQLSSGATELATGATELATGLDTLATGAGDLAGGLRTASDSLPSFSDSESTSIASVIADPVESTSSMDTIFGPTAIPLLAAVVLWFGGLASFIVMRAHTARTLTSRRSSPTLTLRAFWPAALIGAGQGLLVSIIVQFVASYDAAAWWTFAGTAVLAGVVFAAVNQALVAIFGGVGRWVSALIGVLAVATGLISTVPDWLAGLGAALPTSPAFAGLIAGSGSAVAGLVVWGVLALIATTLAVALRRTTSATAVLAT